MAFTWPGGPVCNECSRQTGGESTLEPTTDVYLHIFGWGFDVVSDYLTRDMPCVAFSACTQSHLNCRTIRYNASGTHRSNHP